MSVTNLSEYKAKFKSAVTSAKIQTLSTVDGWMSMVTGMGVPGRDKAESIKFQRRRRIRFETLDSVVRQDGLANKIVCEVVEDGFRCGWRIDFPKEAGVDPEKVNEINKKLDEWHKATKFKQHAAKHFKQARTFGGGLLVLGVDDGQDSRQPLNPESLRTFDWVKPLDRYQMSASGMLDTRPKSPFFGFPLWYFLTSIYGETGFGQFFNGPGEDTNDVMFDGEVGGERQVTRNNTQVGGVNQTNQTGVRTAEDVGSGDRLNNITVHTTRVWRTDGMYLSDRSRLQNEGWGDSVLENAWDPLRYWNSAMKGSGTIIQDFMQGVYKLKGLRDILAANEEGLVQKRFSLMDYLKSIWNVVLLDSDGEEYERKSTSVTGLPELIDRHAIHLSSVTGMSLVKLFGVSPGGFGTGEAEGENWDDRVKSWQEDEVRPMLEYVYGLLFRTDDFKDVPEGWVVEFEQLQLESPAETADTRLKVAQADQIYHGMGALHADEVGESRWGAGKYSMETNLDSSLESPSSAEEDTNAEAVLLAEEQNAAALKEAEENKPAFEPGADGAQQQAAAQGEVQKTALNGAQAKSLQDFITLVAEGTVPAESAIHGMLFAFPTMTEEQARAMIEPALEKVAENEAKAKAMQEAMGNAGPPGATGEEDIENDPAKPTGDKSDNPPPPSGSGGNNPPGEGNSGGPPQ